MNNYTLRQLPRLARIALALAGCLACTAAWASPKARTNHIRSRGAVETHSRPTPPDSFLATKVYSVGELITQVQTHPRIRAVYAKHFNLPESRVVEYMRNNLVESYVPETKAYTCYCVRANGLIYPTKQKFVKGTKVFALRNGEPVLKWVCGNPLSTFLPAVETHTVVHEVPVTMMSPSVEEVTPTDETEVITPTETTPVMSMSFNTQETLNTHFANNVASRYIPSTPEAGNFSFLPFAGLGLVLGTHHPGSDTPFKPGSLPAPVPEAPTGQISMILAAAGALAFIVRARASKQSTS